MPVYGKALRMALFFLCARSALAQGGPPLLTDDPGTPGNRNWEINMASQHNLSWGQRLIQAPLLDINYGWGSRIQLKYQISYLFDRDAGGAYRGAPGNSLLGLKWRFYQQSKEGGWNISTYPQLEVNNPDDSYVRGLVDRGPRLLLPVEISKVFGPVEVNFEAGYWLTNHESHERILGLAFGHQFTRKFEGLSEIYNDLILGGGQRSVSLDIGGRYEFHRNVLFIFMAGRSLGALSAPARDQPAFIGYVGLQVQVKPTGRRRAPNRNRGSK
jgi:hypothetical protein